MPSDTAALTIPAEALRPLVQEVVAETLRAVEAERAKLGERLAYSECEAAALLGLEVHQLRDVRLRGEIRASQIVGRRIRYTRQDLMDYLLQRRYVK